MQHWRWIVASSSFMSHFLFEGIVRSFGLLYMAIIQKFGSGAANTMWLHAIFQTCQQMGVGPFVGTLIEKFGCRLLVSVGGGMLFIAYLTTAFTPNFYFIFFSYSFIGGIGSGLIYITIVAVIDDYFVEDKGKAMGLAALGASVGTFAMPPFIAFLFHSYSFQGAMMILAAVSLNHVVCAGFYRPLSRKQIQNGHGIKVTRDVQDNLKLRHLANDAGLEDEHAVMVCHSKDVKNEHDGAMSNRQGAEEFQHVTGSETASDIQSDQELETPGTSEPSQDTKSGKNKFQVLKDVPFRYNEEPIRQRQLMLRGDYFGSKTLLTPFGSSMIELRKDIESSCIPTKKASLENPSWKNKFQVLKDVPFLMYCFMLYTIPGANVAVFTFLPGLSRERGISDTKAVILLSIIGASNVVGNIIIGFIFDIPCVRRHRRMFHSVIGLLLGVSVVVLAWMTFFVGMAVLASFYGFLLAGLMGQRANALGQYVPAATLRHALGFITVCQGIGNLTGPPLQGYLRDHFDTYSVAFLYGGSLLALSSMILTIQYLACHVTSKD